ncbi:hypothetical protein SAMN04488498_1104 [Mesorhizobium albiziae]|uniref:Uncharacterized protein n=1 Tax=Neomesorhizobium albiziae TaxID=335020 RepID=A0A1I4BC97_9HYPH|nr:hypothetical protein GCM10007937_14450 [Mesorhizobium albiziae]SFK65581.1 hypothetical protein SAMN04488498_1104 [Mesorhizobium albiziae]
MLKTKFITRDSRSGKFIAGRETMTKLNAMEGISQSAASRAMFAAFDHKGASPEQRRKAIAARHSKKA